MLTGVRVLAMLCTTSQLLTLTERRSARLPTMKWRPYALDMRLRLSRRSMLMHP